MASWKTVVASRFISPTAAVIFILFVQINLGYTRRRMKQITFLILLAILLLGCGENEDRIEELEAKIEAIESEFDDVKSKADDLESAVDDLKSEIDDFLYENWRDNVPEVEDAADNVESALDDLKSEINDVGYEF